ncbi:5-formyltetrahydrofolate cyclo-ligase-like protein [Dinothrombium tinctorium]|uniref:5-formyltetrahydrofolate cyclo-ligase n=1 Tax=Dinothrombium tinctorium TaxID=1965070 RepID=A0A3S3S6W3_9ACAR|nr:5-formyltetrahydrofolate cyclo-ligase-like protein [Dinothrombium tinctorium]RWS10018.1 5-formyltetrahydrofolate cyclo-ligase-like protein [Dinothrombium tinctorium]RWS10026.1 5-formyltetrahydrofolate cyclo-ligase-like protein [Dinothrombium tinctorium]
MSEEERRKQSQLVIEKVINHEKFRTSQRVSIFLSMAHEVNTIPILEAIFRASKQCFVPKFEVETKVMKMLELKTLEDYHSLPTTKWNIKQPNDENRDEAFETGGLDLVIVPGVAFTQSGHRLGNGGGFYDAYLNRCRQQKNTYTLAICFKQQIVEHLPTEDHDYVVDEVVFA